MVPLLLLGVRLRRRPRWLIYVMRSRPPSWAWFLGSRCPEPTPSKVRPLAIVFQSNTARSLVRICFLNFPITGIDGFSSAASAEPSGSIIDHGRCRPFQSDKNRCRLFVSARCVERREKQRSRRTTWPTPAAELSACALVARQWPPHDRPARLDDPAGGCRLPAHLAAPCLLARHTAHQPRPPAALLESGARNLAGRTERRPRRKKGETPTDGWPNSPPRPCPKPRSVSCRPAQGVRPRPLTATS
jgi:hypothetical protein